MLQVKEPPLAPLVLRNLNTESHAILCLFELIFWYTCFAQILKGTKQRALGAHPNHQWFISANKPPGLSLYLRVAQVPRSLRNRIDIVQVDQFRQNIEVTRANLLDQENLLQLAVDNYKTRTLGLPPDLPVDIDETLVEGFQLIPIEANPILPNSRCIARFVPVPGFHN